MERNEAIESLRLLYSATNAENKAALECLIPELKESEDERIRKKLHEVICKAINDPNLSYEEREYISKSVLPYVGNLEKLKEREPAEWDEEDGIFLEDALWCVLATKHFVPKYVCDSDTRTSAEKWLKSLPKRLKSLRPDSYKNCNSRWAPSEEQMEALNYAIAEWDGGKRLEGLYALRNDLKKLI